MALKYMLDTDTCIYAMRERSQVSRRLEAAAGMTCMSSVTLGELSFGAYRSTRRNENLAFLHTFLQLVTALPFDDEAARQFGEIKAHLLDAGTPCGPYDMLIGAHARSLRLTLVTSNRREFDRMPGVAVENWAA